MYTRFTNFVMPRPMVVVSLLFILGILIQQKLQLPLGVLGVLAFGVIFWTRLAWQQRTIAFAVLIVICGSIRVAVDTLLPLTHLSKFYAKPDSVYYVFAVVEDVGETRRGTPRYLLKPKLIDEHHISGGSIILYSKDISQKVEPGDSLAAYLLLNTPQSRRNPHDFDYRQYLNKRDVFFEAFLEHTESIQLHQRDGTNLPLLLYDIKQYVLHHFRLYLSPRSAGILSALVLGQKNDIDESIRANFSNTGVIHVLAVSGLHVGYVSLILVTIFGLLRLPHKGQMGGVILGLLFYVGLTGSAPSVMRASIMASLVILGSLMERKSDILNLLAAAAFIILMISPKQLGNIGFQLSFSAVVSIVSLYPIFSEFMHKITPKRSSRIGTVMTAIEDLFLVSLAAQLGTLALTMFYFHKVPIVSLVANMVVVPLIGIIVATGMSFLILGSMSSLLATLWSATLEGAIDFMLWFVQQCAQVSWAYITTRPIHAHELVLMLIAIFGITVLKMKEIIRLWIILALLWGTINIWQDLTVKPELEVVMLDVGQGDAILIHTPNGKTMLVDAGLRFGGKDMGRDVIGPFLRYRNWRYIDILVLTHPHNDHIGGAQHLVENFPIGKILMPDVEYDSYGYRELQESIAVHNIPSAPVYTGHIDSSLKPVYLRATAPKRYDHLSQPSKLNNTSLVIQLFYGETSMMLTGDGEERIEKDQLALGELLKSDLIKAPHHGSKTSSSQEYLEWIMPEISLISLGRKNKFKHPSPTTLESYADLGIKVVRTDLEGAIIYKSNGQRWERQIWISDN